MEIINESLNYELLTDEGGCFIRIGCAIRKGPEDPTVPAEQ